jgi:chromosome segregation ATPase
VEKLKAEVDRLRPTLEMKKREEAGLRKQYNDRKTECENKRKEFFNIDKELRENDRIQYQPPDIASHVS